MKNLKKVLALVLAFACAFTMFAGAVVYPDVPAGSEYSEAITMLSDLGIIQGKDDGKYHSEDTITRAEACALIARMLTGDPQVSQYAGASNFTDVVKGSWKESVVGYCVVNGITVGVGNNKFEPDRAITDAEFVTMVVRAMGYETTGTSYPYGHISAAQANGLLDDVTVVPSSAALRGEDAQIIYNALFADYARGAKQVNTTHGTTVEEYPTIAEDVFGLTRAAVGTYDEKNDTLKKCEAHTWVITDVRKYEDGTTKLYASAIVDDKTTLYDFKKDVDTAEFKYEGTAAEDLEGYQVELWGEGQHGKEEYKTIEEVTDETGKVVKTKVAAFDWEVKAIKTLKGQTAYDYNSTMADSKTDGTLKFDGNELDVDSENYTDNKKDYEDYLNVKNSCQFKLIDWDSDDQVDYIVEDSTAYAKVVSITSKKLKIEFTGGSTLTLDLDKGAIDYEVIKDFWTLKGELPEGLEKDDIIAITDDDLWNKKDDVTTTLTIKVVEPETKELTDVDSKDKAWFDGEKIEVADDVTYDDGTYYFYFESNKTATWYKNLNEEDEDTEYDLYRDANGYIIFAEEAESTSKGYIFVTGLENGADKTGDRNLMQISGRLDDNSKLVDAKVAKDATIKLYDKDAKDYLVDIDFDKNAVTKAQAKKIIGRAFKYSVNDDDQITKLIEVAIPEKNETYSFTDKNDSLVPGTAQAKRTWMDDCKVIFAVRTTDKDGTIDEFTDNNVTKPVVSADDIDLDNVIAVAVEDLPDISADDKTKPCGVHYSTPDNKARTETVVLGVNTFRYFASSSNKAALVTYVKYNSKTEKYTITASVPGMEGTSFTTVARDDLSLAGNTEMEKLQDELKSSGTKHGIFCEVEFNKDGEVSELIRMQKNITTKAQFAGSENGVNNDADECGYTVARVVVDHVANKSSDDYLTVMVAKTNGEGKIYSRNTGANLSGTLELKDSTEYYVIGEDLKMSETDGAKLNAWKDGFDKNFDIDDIEEAKKSDLVSFVNNDTEDDEYVVADIILDGDEVVAVYYYEEPIEETIDESTLPQLTIHGNVDHPFSARNYGTVDTINLPVVCEDGETIKYDELTISGPSVDGIKISKSDTEIIEVKLDGTANVGTYTYTVAKAGHKSASFTVAIVAEDKDVDGYFNAGTYTAAVTVQVNGDLSKLVGSYNLNGICTYGNANMNVPTLKKIEKVADGVYKLTLDTANGTFVAVADDEITYNVKSGNYKATITLTAQ